MQNSDINQCSACKFENPSDARFCQKCGQILDLPGRKCKLCGEKSSTSASYCKHCGSHLDSPLGVLPDRATKWHQFLVDNYSFYRLYWAQGGLAATYFAKSLDILKSHSKSFGNIAFGMPVAPKDWCLESLQIDNQVITSGMLIGAETQLLVTSFSPSLLIHIPYEKLNNFGFIDWQLVINFNGEPSIRGKLKTRGKKTSYFYLATDILNVFAGKSATEQEVSQWGTQQELDRVSASYKEGSGFWTAVINFLNEVCKHRE